MPAVNLMWKPFALPTVCLSVFPGKSNAFAISSKLGLPDYIIEKAKEQISEQDESFEDVLTSLESSRVTIENERRQIEQYKKEVETLESPDGNQTGKTGTSRETVLSVRQMKKPMQFCGKPKNMLTRP